MIETNGMELQPAYGRDYKTKAEVIEAFTAKKDFEGDYTVGFKLCGIQDFAKGVTVHLRYKKLTQIAVFKVV